MRPRKVTFVVVMSLLGTQMSTASAQLPRRQVPALFAGVAHLSGVAEGLKVIVIDGDEAANIVAERIAAEPAIEVRDKDDRRVPGAVVRFVIRKTRDRILASFGNGQAEMRTLTDYSGRARVNAVSPVEPGSFQIDVEVSYRGQTGKAVIRQTNFATSADAKAAGREPGKSTNPTQTATAAAATGAVTTTATTAATTTATTASVAAGGGMSKLAVIGLVAGGAAGAGAAGIALSRKEAPPAPAGRLGAVIPSAATGLQAATAFSFSAQVANFDAGSVAYRWDFGDGSASTEPTPRHVYSAAGTYVVVLTVNDARQSARSETTVTVHTVTGRWRDTQGDFTQGMELTQSAGSISGVVFFLRPQCPVAGIVQTNPDVIRLSQPFCIPPGGPSLAAARYRLVLSADGRQLSGTITGGTSGNTAPIVLVRE